MMQFYYTAMEAAAASLFLIPVFLILNHVRFHSIKSALLYLLFAVYLCGVYAVVGLPNVSYVRFEPNFNFIPLAGMLSDPSGTILNVILFIPLGLFLCLLWKPYRRVQNILLFGFCYSLAIEMLQILTFRATDVNDLITNTAGALVGYWVGRFAVKRYPSLSCRNPISDLSLVICICTAMMFFFQPLIWKVIY